MELETLHEKYKHFFKHLQRDREENIDAKDSKSKVPSKKPDHIFFMAIDAEWYFENGKNTVLSYQIATCAEKKTKNIIKYMDHSKRLKLPEILEYGIRSVTTNDDFLAMKGKKVEVILISHNAIAEWSVLADRDEPYIIKKLTLVRKCLITGLSPIETELEGDFPVRVRVFDTMLLAPASHKSLAKLSTLIGSDEMKKLSIPQHYIENMNLLLRDDPDTFVKYALMDTAVTLTLFFMLQDILNTLVKVYVDVKSRVLKRYTREGGKLVLSKPCIQRELRRVKNGRGRITSNGLSIDRNLLRHQDSIRNRKFVLSRTWTKNRRVRHSRRLRSKREKNSHSFQLYRTLASAGVDSFKNRVGAFGFRFKAYLKKIKEFFSDEYPFVKRTYYGGRNEAFFIGHTDNYPETKDKMWIDIDFIGCYPTANALCAEFDFSQTVDYVPPVYRIDDIIASQLRDKKIPDSTIQKARDALAVSLEELDKELLSLKNRRHHKLIRTAASGYDNRLVDKWYKIWCEAKRLNNYDEVERNLIPGFAKVRFEFPPDTIFPCLPIRHNAYGLLYVLKGETIVPAIEIVQAMDAGAKIEAVASMEFPVYYRTGKIDHYHIVRTNTPHLFARDHLSNLAKERTRNQKIYAADRANAKADAMQMLLKEFTNSLYGKFSQGINPKKFYIPSTGEKKGLRGSSITEPCTAALITSLPRAALSAVLTSIERYNRGKSRKDEISVISATTDGLLIGVPVPEGFTAQTDYFETINDLPRMKSKVKHQLSVILRRFGHEKLLDEIGRHLPIRLMRHARNLLTGDDNIFEIKHLADKIISIKTRGQIGDIYSGQTVLLAKFNLKPPLSEMYGDDREAYKEIYNASGVKRYTEEARWIKERLKGIEDEDDTIESYNMYGLFKFKDIYDSNGGRDLTKDENSRKINADFDWKRKLKWEDGIGKSDSVSPFSLPHNDKNAMIAYRNIMESIRRKGLVARPEEVLLRRDTKGKATYTCGGKPASIARLFIRGLLQEKITSNRKLESYPNEAQRLNVIWDRLNIAECEKKTVKNYIKKTWTENDFKNARRGIWELGCYRSTVLLENLVEELAQEFSVDPQQAKSVIFAIEQFREINTKLIEYVITAVENAHKDNITPFDSLHEKGFLPDREKIIHIFREQLSEREITYWLNEKFIPYKMEPTYRKNIQNLFAYLGIPRGDAHDCASRLIQQSDKVQKTPRNRGQAKCLEHFVLALQQPDYSPIKLKDYEIINNLEQFGLNKKKYYRIKRDRFIPNSIGNTSQNRKLIAQMAKKFNINPVPFEQALLKK